ncbi:MAG TPA: hypothetical protein VJU16_08800 [Planctomycetota bacterium]|nr:hypothetical protein [Planctomycetota bacterium]
MRFLLAGMILVQAAPAQSEADKLEAALKKFGNRTYQFLVEGKKVGTRTLKTAIIEETDRKVAVFEVKDTAGGKQTGTVVENADLRGLRLLYVKVTTSMKTKGDENTLTVEGLKATMRLPKVEPMIIDVTAKTIGEEALLRLVCAAEQKEGAVLKFDLLTWGIPQVEEGRTLKCEGKTQVEIGGKKFDAYLWTGKDPVLDSTYKYWVSPEGYLLRWFESDKIEYVLESK